MSRPVRNAALVFSNANLTGNQTNNGEARVPRCLAQEVASPLFEMLYSAGMAELAGTRLRIGRRRFRIGVFLHTRMLP